MIRLNYIYGLRALAALVIVLHHTLYLQEFWATPRQGCIFAKGAIAFFFVVSGFCMKLNYADDFWTWENYREFILRKIAKLWPLHLLLLSLFVYFGLPHTTSGFWLNVFALHSWTANSEVPYGYNALSWYVSAALALYAIYPVLTKWYVPCLLFAILVKFTGLDEVGLHYWNPLYRVFDFMVGMGVGSFYRNDRGCCRSRIVASFVEMLLLAAVVVVCLSKFYVCGCDVQAIVRVLILAVFVLLFSRTNGIVNWVLASRPLRFVGSLSFEVYMLHIFLKELLLKCELLSVGPMYLRFPAYLLLLLVLAWLVHACFSRQVSRLIVKLYERKAKILSHVRNGWRVDVALLAAAAGLFTLFYGWYNSGVEVTQDLLKNAVVKTDGTEFARANVLAVGDVFMHPGNEPTAVTVPLDGTVSSLELVFSTLHPDCNVKVSVCLEDRVIFSQELVGVKEARFRTSELENVKAVRFVVDKNDQLLCDGIMVKDIHFYRKDNLL